MPVLWHCHQSVFNDHPLPHFHASYGEHDALIEIDSGDVLQGGLPKTALYLVESWREQHLTELQQAWLSAQKPETLKKIAPLK
jgi:hypothetical protein